jgi:hypothetical protein
MITDEPEDCDSTRKPSARANLVVRGPYRRKLKQSMRSCSILVENYQARTKGEPSGDSPCCGTILDGHSARLCRESEPPLLAATSGVFQSPESDTESMARLRTPSRTSASHGRTVVTGSGPLLVGVCWTKKTETRKLSSAFCPKKEGGRADSVWLPVACSIGQPIS